MKNLSLAIALLALLTVGMYGQSQGQNQDPWAPATFNTLKLRAVGPALMSGRVNVVAVHPEDKQTWYIGVASGGVWKTTNSGTTFTPVFQNEGTLLDRARGDRPEESKHGLGWHRRSEQSAQRRMGRRPLSQRRRRTIVDQHGSRRIHSTSAAS